MADKILTQNHLKSVLKYENGNLYWINSRPKIRAGALAGTVSSNGYRVIQLNWKIYKAHRLIFLYHHGYLPERIDHKDRNSLNNNIENLRPCNQSLNMANSSMKSTNTSGYKGVSFRSDTKKWQASLMKNYKKISHLSRHQN